MTGSAHSLASLSGLLDTPTQKIESDEHGEVLSEEYLRYGVDDAQITWECFERLRDRYATFALTRTPLHEIYSEASVGKGLLNELGVKPWRECQPDFPDELIGTIMSSYFGGRSEVQLRRQIGRVRYCDFLSMYPTSCSLMGLWRFVTAERMEYEDATEDARAFLADVRLDDLQLQRLWRGLALIVQVEPNADRVPVRAQYGGGEQYGISLSYLTSTQPIWLTLADCIASKLLTGRAPEVVSAIRFKPVGLQWGLRPLDLLGRPEYRIDPRRDDLFRRLIDLRTEVKRDRDRTRAAGDEARSKPLDAEQLALKIIANATSYGSFIELNPIELAKERDVACFGFEGEQFSASVRRIEKPGRYFHPLLATLITGAARLLLATGESLAEEEGLIWVMGDTDSMALGQAAGMSEDEFVEKVDRVREWFAPLNPYETKGDLLQIEDVNYRVPHGASE